MSIPPFMGLVGRPYEFPSSPPVSFDCWSLVKYIRGNLDLPCPLPFDDTAPWCVPGNLAMGTEAARPLWKLHGTPEQFDMAVLEPAHVGVVLGDGVLHALARNGSVVWTTFAVIRRHWPKAQWWTA